MKTKEEREKAFREDLRQLLLRHNADMKISTEGSYDDKEGVIEIHMPRERDLEGNITFERCDFEFHQDENFFEIPRRLVGVSK